MPENIGGSKTMGYMCWRRQYTLTTKQPSSRRRNRIPSGSLAPLPKENSEDRICKEPLTFSSRMSIRSSRCWRPLARIAQLPLQAKIRAKLNLKRKILPMAHFAEEAVLEESSTRGVDGGPLCRVARLSPGHGVRLHSTSTFSIRRSGINHMIATRTYSATAIHEFTKDSRTAIT